MSVAMESRPQQQQSRPRSKSNFSFKSQNSHASDPNKHERNPSESGHSRKISDSYKPHLNTTGKADPNAAMTEVQPSTSHSSCCLCRRIADPRLQSPPRLRSPRSRPSALSAIQTRMGT